MGLAVATTLLHAGRAPRRLKLAAGVLGFLGATILPGMVTVDFYDLAIATSLPADQAVAVADTASSYGLGALAMVPALVGFALGPVVTLVAAWRGGLVGPWAPALVLAGFVGSFVAPVGAAPMIAA